MANIIVAIIVFGTLGAIVFKMVKDNRKSGSSCHSGCGGCPFACDKREKP